MISLLKSLWYGGFTIRLRFYMWGMVPLFTVKVTHDERKPK